MLWKMDQVNDLPIIIDMSTKPAQADTIINMSPRTAVSRGETSVTCYKIKWTQGNLANMLKPTTH